VIVVMGSFHCGGNADAACDTTIAKPDLERTGRFARGDFGDTG
jgi:hypothetical protein